MANDIVIPEDIRALLDAQIKDELERESSTNEVVYISTKGAKFRIGDVLLESPLLVVINAAMATRSYYDRGYEPGTSFPPACFAISPSPTGISAHEAAPNPQCEGLCKDCPKDEWGSGAGNSKACKEGRSLALYSFLPDSNKIDVTRRALLKLAPTSLKNFSAYVKGLANTYKLSTTAVVTALTFDQSQDYPVVKFAMHSILPIEETRLMLGVYEESMGILSRPPNVSDYEKPNDSGDKSEASARKSKMS